MKVNTAFHSEPSVPFLVLPSDAKDAVCQSFTGCTLALAGLRAVGQEVTVAYDEVTGHDDPVAVTAPRPRLVLDRQLTESD